MKKQIQHLFSEKWFFRILFISLLIYALLRAWLVVPILDELATFYQYIRTGDFFSANNTSDANNHVLNSFFGHQLYSIFGDHFFLFRLSSLLAFPIYFFSVKYIILKSLKKSPIRLLVFMSMVCIPWTFEYFGYSRGYGMSLAFYFAAIAFMIKWKTEDSRLPLFGFFSCLWFAIASNLSYVLPSLILIGYFQLLFFLRGKFGKHLLFNAFTFLLWIAATIPFFRHSFKLKEAGALWWGNQKGLWETTGKSLSELVLFTNHNWVLYLIIVLILFCLFAFIKGLNNKGIWNYLKDAEAIIFLVFMGALIGFVLMRYLLDVNYPMDRVGMYLVPVFLLMISLYLSKFDITKYALLGLLFFPLSFIYHLNLSTSIFSPEDRIPTSFSNKIKSTINENTSLSAEYVSHMSYAYASRNDKKVQLAYTLDKNSNNYGDHHIFWLGCETIDGYSSIAKHPDSKTCLIQRDTELQRKMVLDTIIHDVQTSNRYFTILKESIDSLLLEKQIQVKISGDIDFDQPTMAFNIIQKTLDKNNETISTRAPRFNWYFSDRTDVNFVFTDRIIKLKPEEVKFNFFLMNNDLNKINIRYIRLQIYLI